MSSPETGRLRQMHSLLAHTKNTCFPKVQISNLFMKKGRLLVLFVLLRSAKA
jgi:hypothetical protein